jgi:CRP/FNR family cyclic AMP-dependent transcriptional regulator
MPTQTLPNLPGILTNLDLFRGLTPSQIGSVIERLHVRTVPANANLIIEQQPGQAVYVVLNGTLKVHLEKPNGADVILAILGPGDIAGEMSLIDNTSRSASVTTLEDTELLWMDSNSFQDCLNKFPVMTQNILSILSSRVRRADWHIQSLATQDIFGRVVEQLMMFCNRYGRPDGQGGKRIPIRLTQGDLADLVGASRKRVNQVMVNLRQQKYLSIDDKGYITIERLAEFEKLCGEQD